MFYGADAYGRLLLFVLFEAALIAGLVITVISFIVHRSKHPLAAAILAVIGYLCKLPLYIGIVCFLPETIFYQNFLMCFALAVIIIAATGYTVHMITFAVKDKKHNSEEQENEQGQE